MSLILVSDVFGKTSALEKLSDELGVDRVVDPYNGANMKFKCEAQAYDYFMEQVGLDAYLDKLKDTINAFNTVNLIGFSVGATTIWRLSEQVTSEKVKSAIGFYGSQIRHHAELKPNFKMELIFPKSEPHFDVGDLRLKLSKTPMVSVDQVDSLHGFMNACSANYDQIAYQKQLQKLVENPQHIQRS